MSDITPTAVGGGAQELEGAHVGAASDVRIAPGRSRTPLLVVALAAVVVVLVAVGLLSAKQPQSPESSLERMTRAVRGGDWDDVQKYLDVDAVAGSFVDVTLANALEGDAPGSMGFGSGNAMGGGGNTPGSSGPGIADTMKDAFVRQFRDSLKALVKARGTTAAGEKATLVRMKVSKKLEYISDTEVLVSVQMPADASGTQDVAVRMVQAGDHWRITAFDGMVDLMSLLR